jgi:hypothetical protein
MKKNTLLFMLCVSAFIGTSQVDVTVNPIGLLVGSFGVGGDIALSDNFSTELAVGFGSRSSDDDFTRSYKVSSFRVNAIGKYYFSPDEGADKFYAGAFLRYINRGYSYDSPQTTFEGVEYNGDYDQTRFGLGFLFGYKVVVDSKIIVDFNFGAGTSIADSYKYADSSGNEVAIEWPSLMIVGKLGIGYRFGS